MGADFKGAFFRAVDKIFDGMFWGIGFTFGAIIVIALLSQGA